MARGLNPSHGAQGMFLTVEVTGSGSFSSLGDQEWIPPSPQPVPKPQSR